MSAHQGIKLILMADDDQDDIFLLKQAVASSGLPVEIRPVLNGEELLDYLLGWSRHQDCRRFPEPSLILLDLNMPRKDGREALAAIKAHPFLKKIPVVIYTTSMDPQDIQWCYETGANDYVTKPSNFPDLVAVVQTMEKYWAEDAKPSTESRQKKARGKGNEPIPLVPR